jgi:hypothetical protein
MPDPAPESSAGPETLLCPTCGYDLRGTESGRCSECGTPVDVDAARASAIPWVRRRALGPARAYLLTVWRVTLGDQRLAQEAIRSHDLHAARAFRAITAALLGLVFVGIFIAVVVLAEGFVFLAVPPEAAFWPGATGEPAKWMYDFLVPWSAGATLPPVLPAILVAAAFHLTGAHRALFRAKGDNPGEQQQAEALACYAAAPVLWLVVPACLALALALVLTPDAADQWRTWISGTVFCLVALALGVSMLRIVQWAARVRRRGAEWALLDVPHLLARWAFGLTLLFGAVPWCVGFFWIIIDSFR